MALELRLRDRARATKDIDVVLRDPSADLTGALEEALIGAAYQGFSFRRKGQPLVDLLLMEAMITHDYAALCEACQLVFHSRNTHAWPPDLNAVPTHWAEPFAQLAEELELPDANIETALVRVRTLVARILDATS